MSLANEKYHFRESWIDMQEGYYLLFVKDYATTNTVDFRQPKHAYTSEVKILSSQEEVIDHLKFAFQRVSD